MTVAKGYLLQGGGVLVLRVISVVIAVIFGGSAGAQTSNLRSLETLQIGREWVSVGRLILNYGVGFCTATLISNDLILTAAHCLYDPDTGRKYELEGYEFQAGWRNGRAESYRRIRAAAAHPKYLLANKSDVNRLKYDVALLRLDTPIRKSNIPPVAMSELPKPGDSVGVVSYARGRVNAPSIQDTCVVQSEYSGVLVMTCSVDYGASGSPVLVSSNGQPQITGVVSAMAEMNGRLVSLGTSLRSTVPDILPLMAPKTEFSSVNQRRDTGAKFGSVAKRKAAPLETE